MDRADDAKKRLEALHEPVPHPTKAAVAQNKAEIASRGERSMFGSVKGLIKKGPDVSQAATVGEPPLLDPELISATKVQQDEAKSFVEPASAGTKNVGVEIINPNQPATAPPAGDTTPSTNPFGATPAAATPPAPAANDPNELKPNQPADPNDLTPTSTGTDNALPPPTQVNEIQNQSSSSSTAKADDSTPASDEDISSSKKKKKKGLSKINPF
jgi:outer membrane protein assembly factor BamD